jgi:hypothetical protein
VTSDRLVSIRTDIDHSAIHQIGMTTHDEDASGYGGTSHRRTAR